MLLLHIKTALRELVLPPACLLLLGFAGLLLLPRRPRLGRILIAWDLERRFTPDRNLVSPHWLVPVKDLLHFVVWLNSFWGNTVIWRGERMRLHSDGTLTAIEA